MHFSPVSFWLICGLVLVGLELLTGTFYLLIIGVGTLLAAAVAWLGQGPVIQLLAASIGSLLGVLLLWQRRKADTGLAAASPSLDIGQQVERISSPQDRLQVRYRGTVWQAEWLNAPAAEGVPLYIHAMRQNVLIISDQPVQQA